MCLYGFIPVFGGSYSSIHHPPLCPDSSLHWHLLTLTTPFTAHYILIYGLVFIPIHCCVVRVMVYLWLSEVEWVAEPLAISPPPPAVEPAWLTCSVFVQHLQSSSCMMYQSVPVFFLSLPLSYLPFFTFFPSRPSTLMSLVLLSDSSS